MIIPHDRSSSKKRLAMFFDGTWNEPENHTNVYRLYLMLSERGEDGLPQKPYYDQGVGTHWFDRISGGAFGWGLSKNICEGYRWLMENYNEGDEIFIFGFSRGVFTARSLAGLIANCGLLKPDAAMSFEQLYDRYRRQATPIYRLLHQRAKEGRKDFDFEEQVLLDHSWYRRDLIKMVGVWDTVGSLGVPFGRIPGIGRHTLQFHNTHLSTVVQHNYHAMALDEHRKPYWAMLWTTFLPFSPDETHDTHDDRMIEQRWFSGAHCDVGGGYRNDVMSQRPLAWLQQKAKLCRLGFRDLIEVDEDQDLAAKPRDSYGEFLCHLWRFVSQPYVRWVQSRLVWKKMGRVSTVNERIDRSIFDRRHRNQWYRPTSLQEWADRKGLNLDELAAHPEGHPELYAPVTTCGIEPNPELGEISAAANVAPGAA